MSNNDKLQVLGSVGDVNPIEYGGGYILRNDADDRPCLEYFDGLESVVTKAWDVDIDDTAQTDKIKIRLYNADLETSGERFMSDLDWVDWSGIASYTGTPIEHYTASVLDDLRTRAQAACDVASFHGWENLDSYPLELTLTELIARWKDL